MYIQLCGSAAVKIPENNFWKDDRDCLAHAGWPVLPGLVRGVPGHPCCCRAELQAEAICRTRQLPPVETPHPWTWGTQVWSLPLNPWAPGLGPAAGGTLGDTAHRLPETGSCSRAQFGQESCRVRLARTPPQCRRVAWLPRQDPVAGQDPSRVSSWLSTSADPCYSLPCWDCALPRLLQGSLEGLASVAPTAVPCWLPKT